MVLHILKYMKCKYKQYFLAVSKIKKEENIDVKPEIMIPLVGFENELSILKDLVNNTAKENIRKK